MSTEILCSSTGLRQLKAVHSAATVAHVPVLLAAGLVAIPVEGADAGEQNTFNHEVECLAVDKAAGQAWAGGAKIYFNNAAKNFTTASSGNTLCGYAVQPAEAADVRGQIQLTPNA